MHMVQTRLVRGSVVKVHNNYKSRTFRQNLQQLIRQQLSCTTDPVEQTVATDAAWNSWNDNIVGRHSVFLNI